MFGVRPLLAGQTTRTHSGLATVHRLGPLAVLGCVGLLGATTGCGAGQFNGTLYKGDGFAFRIPKPPAEWTPIDVSGAALAFRDERAQASILLNARCGSDADDVPLIALTNHLFLQFTDREQRLQQVVAFDGREAMHTELVAKLDGVALFYDAWVLKKDGCVYDLLYMAPPADAERGLEAFHRLAHGFATVSPDAD
jgi:hypothetical protein